MSFGKRPPTRKCGAGCEAEARRLKPSHRASERPMSGILAIVIFLAVIAGLNRFEFGRFD